MNDWTSGTDDEPARPLAGPGAPTPPPVAPPTSPWAPPSAVPAPPAYGAPTAPPPGSPAASPWGPPPSAPAEPYRVGGAPAWPTAPPGPGAPGGFGAPPAAPVPPGRSRGRAVLIGVAAVVVVVGLLAGAFVWLRGDDGTVTEPVSDVAGSVTTAPVPTAAVASGTPPVAGTGSEPIADVAAAVGPAVVLIATDEGEGSGIIYDKSGLIVTNAHVVGTSTTVAVQLADGTVFDAAKVVGTDPVRDVAVVKVEPKKDLTAATFGRTDDVRVGQTAVAIGSPFGLEQTVTAGIVSAIGRVISNQNPVEMIQTDAPINPGNSGGALADKQGRVIGMNTSIRTTGSNSGSVGVGFAVPADTFLAIANRIVKGESLAVAYLGIRGQAPTGGGNSGVVISTVQSGSPAASAGLKVGDLITALNGQKVTTMLGMSARVQLQKPGDVIELTVVRDGSTQKIKVTLGTLTR